MAILSNNFYDQPLLPAATFYTRLSVLFASLAFFCIGGTLKAYDVKLLEASMAMVFICIGVVLGLMGVTCHAYYAKLRGKATYGSLILHILGLVVFLCAIIVTFNEDSQAVPVKAVVKFLELFGVGLAVGALMEFFKNVAYFAVEEAPIEVVVTSVASEFDERTGREVLVVEYDDATNETPTPLRIVKQSFFQSLVPGSRLSIVFKVNRDATRQIARISRLY